VKFLDTNVLLYAISKAPAERRKAAIAITILEAPAEDLAISVQVLQEFYVQATRSSRKDALPQRLAEEYLDLWQTLPVQESTLGLFRSAVATSRRFGISYWDSAILEAARLMGCDTVLSEDLADGQSYAGIRVTNPFRASPHPRRG